jgi:hypothetical protein
VTDDEPVRHLGLVLNPRGLTATFVSAGGTQGYGRGDMVTHMKTTVEISDSLLTEAKDVATRQGTTLRSLLEAALRAELDRRRTAPAPYRLVDVAVGDPNVVVDLGGEGWAHALDAIYEGRGA